MRAVDIIRNKRDGGELTTEEIRFLIDGYCRGEVPDYQMAAWAMAVFYKGMTAKETAELTMAMADSGDRVDLSGIAGIKVDKHSTGGVGDKTTIALVPLVAAAGVPVAKMSGRGLGHTGGTIDKLEAIPGFRTELTRETFLAQVGSIGAAVVGQSGNLTPADKKLYALRDVTATVESIPLIASSVMSKKIAAGADAIVLDVKAGGGAFMKTVDDAIRLAQAMVAIGREVGRETVAVITGMDEPLGFGIGNALEVREAIETVSGRGPADLTEVCLTLGSHMLVLAGAADGAADARAKLERVMRSGAAAAKLRELIAAQGGDSRVVDDPGLLPAAAKVVPVVAAASGFVRRIEAERLGLAAMRLGAGRAAKDDAIDPAVGIVLRKKIGDPVAAGETLAELHVGDGAADRLNEAHKETLRSFDIGSERGLPPSLVYAVVTGRGVERADR